jgi:hypothetical protein
MKEVAKRDLRITSDLLARKVAGTLRCAVRRGSIYDLINPKNGTAECAYYLLLPLDRHQARDRHPLMENSARSGRALSTLNPVYHLR